MNARCLPPIALGLALILLSGCDAPKKTGGAPEQKSREIIGKKTQNVLKLDEALKDGGKLAATNITATDYLGALSGAYKSVVFQAADSTIKTMMVAYDPLGDKTLTYDEFMTNIIKKGQPDGVELPLLPYYLEYAYDEAGKKLVVVEFPEKKAQFQKQQDEKLGR